jgi:uncharacterized lipoprotein YddW (UPF0748 family)
MKKILSITLIFSLFLSITLFIPKSYGNQSEIRGIWFWTNHILDNNNETIARVQLMQEFQLYKELNITEIFFLVKDSYFLYNTNISTNALGYDALKLACELAPQYGLNIHAWYCVMRDTYLISQNETYAMVKIDGSINYEWMNPVYPEVHGYILSIVNELLHYPIKGIHLDYMCFPTNQYSYDNYSRSLFQSEYGFDPINDPNNETWVNWRCQQITNIVNEIKVEIKTFNSSLILSSANSWYSKERLLEDWLNWKIDWVIPMAYTDSSYLFERTCKMAKPKEGASKVLMGIGLYVYNDSSILIQQINMTRQYGFSGWSLFRDEYLYNDDFIKTIKNIDQTLNVNPSPSTIWYHDPKMFAIVVVLCFMGILVFKEFYK